MLIRASKAYELMTGTIGLSDVQKNELKALNERKFNSENAIKVNEKSVKPLTALMEDKRIKLTQINNNNELPLTLKKKFDKLYRNHKFNRSELFTNKFVQKGILQEEEAVSFYQKYLQSKGKKIIFLTNNKVKVRLENEYFTGEPDLTDTNDVYNCNEGFDIKCSWSLDSFPFPDEDLDKKYIYQNLVYMILTGAKKWTTAYVLVNATERMVFQEKEKFWYAYNMPSLGDKFFDVYISKCKEIEKNMIFDYDKFIKDNPNHDILISRKDWFDSGLYMDINDRVIEKTTYYNEAMAEDLVNRIKLGYKYLGL
jgi:hypothetical protein